MPPAITSVVLRSKVCAVGLTGLSVQAGRFQREGLLSVNVYLLALFPYFKGVGGLVTSGRLWLGINPLPLVKR